MYHIKIAGGSRGAESGRDLTFYLATEEYLARNLEKVVPAGPRGRREAFFLWKTGPTVIYGRNQIPEAELNLEWCKSHGVNIVRRKSGGGCVWSDWGNIMVSYISDTTDVGWTFDYYLQRLVLALKKLGINAERSGRNDVMVDGRKVSGNAFMLLPQASIVHGTMLYKADFDSMSQALTPPAEKIRSKGVSSVRQHVLNLSEIVPWDEAAFSERLAAAFGGADARELELSAEDINAIEEIEKTYLDPDFKAGRNHRLTVSRSGRIEGVGDIAVEMEKDGGKICRISVTGDFFPVKQGLDEALTESFGGLTEEEVVRKPFPFGDYVMALTAEDFARIAFATTPNKHNNTSL